MDIDEASNSQYFGENTAEEYEDRVSESVRLDIATCDEEDPKKTTYDFKSNHQRNQFRVSNTNIFT